MRVRGRDGKDIEEVEWEKRHKPRREKKKEKNRKRKREGGILIRMVEWRTEEKGWMRKERE